MYGVLRKITDSEPRPIREISPAIPDWLAALIKKLHAKQPRDRQGSAEEVMEVLEQCHWNQKRAAEVLRISKATLWRKLRAYGIDVSKLPDVGGVKGVPDGMENLDRDALAFIGS